MTGGGQVSILAENPLKEKIAEPLGHLACLGQLDDIIEIVNSHKMRALRLASIGRL